HIFALDGPGDVVGVGQVKHQDGQPVVAAEGGRGAVHDVQLVLQHLGERQGIVLFGVGVLVGVLVVDAVHHGGLEHHVGGHLHGPQGGGGVGGEEGVAGAASKDGHLARLHGGQGGLAVEHGG